MRNIYRSVFSRLAGLSLLWLAVPGCTNSHFQVRPTAKFNIHVLREKKLIFAVGVANDREAAAQCISPLSPAELETTFYQTIKGDTFHTPSPGWPFDAGKVPLEADMKKDFGFGNFANYDAALKMARDKGYYGVVIGMVVVSACRDAVDTFTGWGNQDKVQLSTLWTLQNPEGEEIWSASIHFKEGYNGLDAGHIKAAMQQLAIKVTRAILHGKEDK